MLIQKEGKPLAEKSDSTETGGNPGCFPLENEALSECEGGVDSDSMMTNQQGKPDAGKPHVRFDEGEASRPFLGGNLSTLLKLPHQGLLSP